MFFSLEANASPVNSIMQKHHNRSVNGFASIAWLRENANDIIVKIEVTCNITGKLILSFNNLIVRRTNGKVMEIQNDETSNYVRLVSGKWEVKIFSK